MIAHRYLIRVFSGGVAAWFADAPDIDSLAKAFDLADEEHSVYEVADGEEECLAVKAECTTNMVSKARSDHDEDAARESSRQDH